MNGIKESVLNMPAWKAGIAVLILFLSMSVLFEIVLSHMVFHTFDRFLNQFEQDLKSDLADLDEMDQMKQSEFCTKYQFLLVEQANLAKQNPHERSFKNAEEWMLTHEHEIKRAMESHNFDLEKCKMSLKAKA